MLVKQIYPVDQPKQVTNSRKNVKDPEFFSSSKKVLPKFEFYTLSNIIQNGMSESFKLYSDQSKSNEI